MVISPYFSNISSTISNQYLLALLVLIASFIIVRLVLEIISRISLFLTKRTKTNIDDQIIERTNKPLTYFSFLIAIYLSVLELNLQTTTEFIATNLILTLIAISVAHLIYSIIDVILVKAWDKITNKSKLKVNQGLSSMITTILRVVFVAAVILYILELWGVEIGPLLAGLGIAGLAVALALQPVLANIFSGMSMILDKSVRIGDWLILEDGTWGIIEKISIRSTKIRNFDNELVTVPNSKLADSNIHNVAMPEPQTRVVIPFGVAYGSDIDKVKSLVMKELKTLKHYIPEPEPKVRFLEFGDSSLNFKAFFFVDSYENRYDTIDEANTKIYNALNKARISIPFPQRDIHVKNFPKK